MANVFDEFPARDDVLRIQTNQLAERLLRDLDVRYPVLERAKFLSEVTQKYGRDNTIEVKFVSAWATLVRDGFLVERHPGSFLVSEKGEREQKRLQFEGLTAPVALREIGARWIVERALSGGGQGLTSIVRDKHGFTDEMFVVKELPSTADTQARGRFATEVNALQRLKHPNILSVVGFDQNANPPWYVSEYCAGGGLDKVPLPELDIRTRLRLFLDACRGLAAAHKVGITHRDLKPENVLLRSANGPAVLGDFGLCWLADSDGERLTRANEDIGSSFCRAPEFFDGPNDEVAPSADIYCLGKLLYWIVLGKGGRAGRLQREEFDVDNRNLVTILNDSHYGHINSLLGRMINLHPAARFQDAGEAYEACERAFDLFLGNYEPINTAPGRCKYCGEANYQERSRALPDAERIILKEWHAYECSVCGHTLLFNKNKRNGKW